VGRAHSGAAKHTSKIDSVRSREEEQHGSDSTCRSHLAG
jgi:hypothetical protein